MIHITFDGGKKVKEKKKIFLNKKYVLIIWEELLKQYSINYKLFNIEYNSSVTIFLFQIKRKEKKK